MKKIFLSLVTIFSLVFFTGCEEDKETTVVPHISFQKDGTFGVEIGGTTTREVKVYVTQASSQDRVFDLKVDADLTTLDPASYTMPATVTVPANSREGSFNLTISDLNLSSQKVLAIAFDGTDGLYTGAPLKLAVKQECLLNEVKFSIILDRYGEETRWDIKQGSTVVASGGPYTRFGSDALQPEKEFIYCLPAGNYVLTVYDAYGDGMVTSSTVVGSYKLFVNSVQVVSALGNFTTSRSHSFVLN